jgi:hypothetical protein
VSTTGLDHPSHQEFATLTPNNVVYKLVGPVLIKQDQAEAKNNIDKRLEFIRREMSVWFRLPPRRWSSSFHHLIANE